MGSIARLAWRNVWRHARRTQLLLAVVAYASIAIVFFWGFFDGVVDMMITSQARYLESPVLVTRAAYVLDPDPDFTLGGLAFLPALREHPGVSTATLRLELQALLRSPYHATGVKLRGIDPELEPAVSALPSEVREGRMLSQPGELVLGVRLAERLDVRVGERLVADVQSAAGARASGLRVVGLIDAGMRSVDETVVLIHLADARALSGIPTATGVALDVPAGREQAVAASLNASGVLPGDVRAFDIYAQLSGLLAGIENKRVTMMPILALFSLFAAVTVMSTVVVSVIERTREFGVVAALGLSQAQIARMVMLEAAFVTGLGFVIGSAAGFALNGFLTATNLMGPMMKAVYSGMLEGFALSDELAIMMQLSYLAWTGSTILLAAVLAIAVPGRHIRTLNPAEAMRAG